jgi:hypothetical protein
MYVVDREEFGKLVFGRPGRLRLAAWLLREIAVDAYFYQDQARKGTDDVPNEVRANLQHFEKLGLVKTAYRDPGPGRRLYYQRTGSPTWAVFDAALQAIASTEKEARRSRRSPA